MARDPVILPPFYYHDHFMEMIRHVVSLYADFLGNEERAFIDDFTALDMEAQCLFIRMSNRKKAVFSPEDLHYNELGQVWSALERLKETGFLRNADESDYRACLDGLNKQSLLKLAGEHGLGDIKASWSKALLVAHICDHLPCGAFFVDKLAANRFVLTRTSTLNFLLYLYFGKLDDNLSRFALRDMGILAARSRQTYQARFQSPAEAWAGFFYKQTLKDLKTGGNADRVWASLADWPVAETEFAIALRNSLLHQLGLGFERRKDIDQAKAAYSLSTAFESQERRVRILYGQGAINEVRALLDAMLQSPDHDEASIFASDFFSRKFGQQRVGIYTQLLREAQTIEVDALYRGDPELGAMEIFERDGWTCHYTENGLWPVLFALLFWDELFESEEAYSSDFDHLPKALKDGGFHRRYAKALEERLDLLRRGQAIALIKGVIARHRGEANGLFYWFDELEAMLTDLLSTAPHEAVARLIAIMAQDFNALRDGFPDLMLVREGQLRFVEIKGEGDQVRRNQLARLNLLRGLGFDAGICRLTYRHDPDQVYVVVDVETTGGRPPNDRVTEIGAVKVQHGEVIDEWSSLINPERRIAAFITDLTGISNDMVADAPRFADVADELDAFLSGAIFVAHNVNFDYGFISSEYRRLGRRFRYPKLCTVASMRKLYPGLASYSLANLCREFGIELRGHHRALNDARAAAGLLGLINEKRLDQAA